MKTYNRLCIKDYTVKARNGDCLELKRGKEYLTSEKQKGNKVVVFSKFWVPVPLSLFAGEVKFT